MTIFYPNWILSINFPIYLFVCRENDEAVGIGEVDDRVRLKIFKKRKLRM